MNYYIIITLLFINIIYNNFIKKININFVEMFKNNNFVWDYVSILNDNNKSLFLFLFTYILISMYFYKSKRKNKILLTNILFLIFLYIISIDINNCNYYLTKFNVINNNLINGLIIIHPVCMYLTYIFFILVIFNIYNYNNKKINYNLINIINNNNNLILFSVSSLILGSY